MRTGVHLRSEIDAVVIGASAGGMHALREVLSSLPADFAPPVLAVLHLPRERASRLPALFGPYCALPVHEAFDKQPLSSGMVVFAPPDYHLLVEDRGQLALSIDDPVLYSRPAIDPLFESAAFVYGNRLLAILLTGASADGSEGIAAVRAAGGVAWVQDPADASSNVMPAAALARAGADEILSLDDLCKRLAAY